jgi:DNA-directed RNA polymerase subunit RPC12/RpoP
MKWSRIPCDSNIMFSTTCTYCGLSLEVPPHYHGREMICTSCRMPFIALPPEERQFEFLCPICKGSIEAAWSMVGITAPCPHCNVTVDIPQPQLLENPTVPEISDGLPPESPHQTIHPVTTSFSCPHCDAPIEADSSQCGMAANCPTCGQPIVVPNRQVVKKQYPSPPESPIQSSSPSPRSENPTPRMVETPKPVPNCATGCGLLLIVLGSIFLMIICIIFLAFLRSLG